VVVLRIYELSVVVRITSCYHCKIEKAAVVVRFKKLLSMLEVGRCCGCKSW
jgi:hypothetical protein